MTRKHFEHAATLVREMVADPEYSNTQCALAADAYIKLFVAFNPRFDTKRFLRACGLNNG